MEKTFLTPLKSLKRALSRKLTPAKSLVKLNSRKLIPAKYSVKPNMRRLIPAKCPEKEFAKLFPAKISSLKVCEISDHISHLRGEDNLLNSKVNTNISIQCLTLCSRRRHHQLTYKFGRFLPPSLQCQVNPQ